MRATPLLALLLAACSRSTPSESVAVLWTFEPVERGAIVSPPAVRDKSVYVITIRDEAFQSLGTLHKLSLDTGKPFWRFDDGGDLRHSISQPTFDESRLFVGEGMHANHFCHLFAVDQKTGERVWKFRAEGHLESSPVCSGNEVIFGAGDDGVYSLNAETGKENWHFKRSIHVDSRPEVSDTSVFVGSGVSRAFRNPGMLCLDRKTGRPIWEVPEDLPVWGSPRLDGGTVYFGLGNGRLNASASGDESPRGAVVALDAATGKQHWRFDCPDAVMSRPVTLKNKLFFTCRDRHLYCLDTASGNLIWKQSLGSPIVADPAVSGDRVYAVSTEGRAVCFSADGKERWRFEVGTHAGAKPVVFSSPAVLDEPDRPRRILFGTELKNAANSAAVLYCLQESIPNG